MTQHKQEQKEKTCPECGDAPVNHAITWVNSAADGLFSRPTLFLDHCWGHIESLVGDVLYNKFSPALFKTLAVVHLGKIVREPDENVHGRARVLWQEAIRRGILLYEFRLFDLGREAFVAQFHGQTVCFESLPRPGVADSASLDWMDNKGIMRKRFAAAGIPISRGGQCFSYRTAIRLFNSLEKPLIVKPHTGSRSRHTTTHVVTEADFKAAFHNAKKLSPFVIIEEEDRGSVYRGTVIGGKVAGVLRRDPPLVVGDGVHTLQELVDRENANPLRQGPIFHQIVLRDDKQVGQDKELARQGLALESIPPAGMQVTLSEKASRGIGGTTVDVTDETHPDTIALLENSADVLGDSIVGVDFIIEDITKSWREQRHTSIIECNSLPFIDLHHFPFSGKPRNVAGLIWDLIFPESSL